MSRKVVISADGSVVPAGDATASDSGSGSTHTPLSSLRSGGNIDVFGFNLEPRQFLVVLALSTLMLGVSGTFGFVICLGAYTIYQRGTDGVLGLGGGPGAGVTTSSDAAAARWGQRRGGANIKGVSDLPKPLPPPS